jgi:hypothetical protein
MLAGVEASYIEALPFVKTADAYWNNSLILLKVALRQ